MHSSAHWMLAVLRPHQNFRQELWLVGGARLLAARNTSWPVKRFVFDKLYALLWLHKLRRRSASEGKKPKMKMPRRIIKACRGMWLR